MAARGVGQALDYDKARQLLNELYAEAEVALSGHQPTEGSSRLQTAVKLLFASKTQSYREVALGCALIHLLDSKVDLRLPYVSQGLAAYSGRTFDEKVVNPFLHDRQIPASKGPYLATFRRSVRFDDATRSGMRDQEGYDAFLTVLSEIEAQPDDVSLRSLIRYLLEQFILLRESARIAVARINRISVEQWNELIHKLLLTPSGGLLPLLLTVAMLETISKCFQLHWQIKWQGINVADRAAGAPGDITVYKDDRIQLALEITERAIDRARVVSTFNTKISPFAVDDYLFAFTNAAPLLDARQYARVLFGQGHDVNFVELQPWLVNNLATIGSSCRADFGRAFPTLLDQPEVPASIKVKWNDLVKELVR